MRSLDGVPRTSLQNFLEATLPSPYAAAIAVVEGLWREKMAAEPSLYRTANTCNHERWEGEVKAYRDILAALREKEGQP